MHAQAEGYGELDVASKPVDGGSIQGSQGSFGCRVASPSKSNLDLGTGV